MNFPSKLILSVALTLVGLTASAAASDLTDKLFRRDVDVITVTDMTEKGRKFPPPKPDRPIYYMMIDLGQKVIVSDRFNSGLWAGEQLPDQADARNWVIAALAEQGFRPGDLETHLPLLLIYYSWGMVQGSNQVSLNEDKSFTNPSLPALEFLGGEKLGLTWEKDRIGAIDARLLMRGFQRMGVSGKVLDFAGGNLFLARVQAFTIDSLKAKNKTLLWETRFACPSDGLAFSESLPLMIKAAAPNFGRETVKPVNVNATQTYGGGHVELGELKVIGTVPEKPEDEKSPDKK